MRESLTNAEFVSVHYHAYTAMVGVHSYKLFSLKDQLHQKGPIMQIYVLIYDYILLWNSLQHCTKKKPD